MIWSRYPSFRFREKSGTDKVERTYLHNLLQFRVFNLGLFQDGNVGVGVYPERDRLFTLSEDLFLAQKIQVGVTAGMRIDDCRKVA